MRRIPGTLLPLAVTVLLAMAQERNPPVTGKAAAEHYTWGNCCDGWYLVKTPELNVIQERMPANTSETRHRHLKSRQFFFVLSGTAEVDRDGHLYTVRSGEGLEVPPGAAHKVANRSAGVLELLVTSPAPKPR